MVNLRFPFSLFCFKNYLSVISNSSLFSFFNFMYLLVHLLLSDFHLWFSPAFSHGFFAPSYIVCIPQCIFLYIMLIISPCPVFCSNISSITIINLTFTLFTVEFCSRGTCQNHPSRFVKPNP